VTKKQDNKKTAIRVYIAGKMTGLPDYNRPAFYLAAEELKAKGLFPLHVAMQADGFEHSEYMIAAFAMLDTCHFIAMLPGWKTSIGAIAEHKRAIQKGIAAFEFEELLKMNDVEIKRSYEKTKIRKYKRQERNKHKEKICRQTKGESLICPGIRIEKSNPEPIEMCWKCKHYDKRQSNK
jgi:hypothetical protein